MSSGIGIPASAHNLTRVLWRMAANGLCGGSLALHGRQRCFWYNFDFACAIGNEGRGVGYFNMKSGFAHSMPRSTHRRSAHPLILGSSRHGRHWPGSNSSGDWKLKWR